MKKALSLLLLIALLAVPAMSWAEQDAVDVNATAEKFDELGIPTVESVAELKNTADALWKEEKWAEAAEAYEAHATSANWLANLIKQGLEPYYSSSSDTKKNVTTDMLKKLSNLEAQYNNYVEARNSSIARQGLCYYNLGEYSKAMTYMSKALDLLTARQIRTWNEILPIYYSMIGVTYTP